MYPKCWGHFFWHAHGAQRGRSQVDKSVHIRGGKPLNFTSKRAQNAQFDGLERPYLRNDLHTLVGRTCVTFDLRQLSTVHHMHGSHTSETNLRFSILSKKLGLKN